MIMNKEVEDGAREQQVIIITLQIPIHVCQDDCRRAEHHRRYEARMREKADANWQRKATCCDHTTTATSSITKVDKKSILAEAKGEWNQIRM